MIRTTNTSSTSHSSINSWNRFYSTWCEGRRELGLPCSRKLASKELDRLTALYRTERRKTPKLADAAGSFDRSYGGDDLIDNVVSSNATPITQGEQDPASPLFTEVGSVVGSFVLDSPPVVQELTLPGYSPTNEVPVLELPYTAYQPSFTTPSAFEESPAGPLPTPSSAATSAYSPSENHFLGDTDFQSFDEPAFNYSDFFFGTPSATASTETSSDLHTPVSTAPATGYPTPGLVTPGSGLLAQELPAGLDDDQFVFNSAEAATPEQPMWSTCPCPQCVGQQSLVPSSPVLPTAAPTPVPSPVPAVQGQLVQSVEFSNDLYSGNETAQALEADQPQAALPLNPLVSDQSVQNVRLDTIQRVLNAVNTSNIGQGGKPGQVGLSGVHIWFSL